MVKKALNRWCRKLQGAGKSVKLVTKVILKVQEVLFGHKKP